MNPQLKQALTLYREMHEFYVKMLPFLEEFERVGTPEDMVDILYALRKSKDMADEIKRKMNALSTVVEKLILIAMATKEEVSFAGVYAKASVKTSMSTEVPSPKSGEVYEDFMKYLGVTDQSVIDFGLLRIHFPSWGNYYTAMLEAGIDLPESLSNLKQYDTSNVQLRKRKDLLES